MSRPRYNWWPCVLNVIRDYPRRCEDRQALKRQRLTASTDGSPVSGSASRTTENVALRQLPRQEQKEYDAVRGALTELRRSQDAAVREKVVRLCFWRGYSIGGAAAVCHISDRTARRYRRQFILLVALWYGELTREEYEKLLREGH